MCFQSPLGAVPDTEGVGQLVYVLNHILQEKKKKADLSGFVSHAHSENQPLTRLPLLSSRGAWRGGELLGQEHHRMPVVGADLALTPGSACDSFIGSACDNLTVCWSAGRRAVSWPKHHHLEAHAAYPCH